jgi:hypothetical protein
MYVLSFRDMSVNACAGVTAAAIYDLGGVPVTRSWWPAQSPFRYRLVDFADFAMQTRGKHVCFLVHGFNVDRDSGYSGFGAAAQEMGADGALYVQNPPLDLYAPQIDFAVPLLWAGDGILPLNYPFLLGGIRSTGRYFAQFLTGAKLACDRISFVTHSMGARVVLECVQQSVVMAGQKGFKMPVVDHVIFTAGAASDEVLDDPDYAAAVDAVQNFVVVSSRADTVLSEAFPAGNAVEQALWNNDPGADDALGRYGPRLKPGSKALGKTRWFPMPAAGRDAIYAPPNHGDYFPKPWAPVPGYPNGWAEDPVIIGQLSQAILGGQTPPFPPEVVVTPRE